MISGQMLNEHSGGTHCPTPSPITVELLEFLGGRKGVSRGGGQYWDFPIVTEHSKGETFLRVHEACSFGGWGTDLMSVCDHPRESQRGVGIVNWPETEQQLRDLLRILGCPVKCSLCQGIQEEGQCQACGRMLPRIPIGG